MAQSPSVLAASSARRSHIAAANLASGREHTSVADSLTGPQRVTSTASWEPAGRAIVHAQIGRFAYGRLAERRTSAELGGFQDIRVDARRA